MNGFGPGCHCQADSINLFAKSWVPSLACVPRSPFPPWDDAPGCRGFSTKVPVEYSPSLLAAIPHTDISVSLVAVAYSKTITCMMTIKLLVIIDISVEWFVGASKMMCRYGDCLTVQIKSVIMPNFKQKNKPKTIN